MLILGGITFAGYRYYKKHFEDRYGSPDEFTLNEAMFGNG
jgi:hypothetical protein